MSATNDANATEVRETIEAKPPTASLPTKDVEMKDLADEDGEEDADGEADVDMDAEGEDDDSNRDGAQLGKGTREMLQTIQDLSAYLCAYKEE